MIIKTISTVDGVNVVDFGNTVNKYYWFKNLGDSTIYAANKEDFKAGDDGVSELTAKGDVTNIEASDGKVYILGAGKVEIHNTDSKLSPFKSAPVAGSGGGGTAEEWLDSLKQDLDALSQNVDDISDDVDSLRSRFDNTISAITTDTEVIDIRVGADGTTYQTAGEAVRGQVGELKQDLDNLQIKENINEILYNGKPNVVNGYYFDLDGTINQTEYYCYTDEIEVTHNSKVFGIGKRANDGYLETLSMRFVAININNKWNSYYGEANSTEYTVPMNGKIRISINTNTYSDFYLYIVNDGISTTMVDEKLKGKTVYGFGDSLVYGHYSKVGMLDLLCDKEGMIYKKYAVNGAKITGQWEILKQIILGDTVEPDFVIFDGGANDAFSSSPIGEFSEEYTSQGYDTFIGAFDTVCKNFRIKYPNAKIIYVSPHKMPTSSYESQKTIHDCALMVCDKYSISVVDIFKEGQINTNIESMKNEWSYDTAGQTSGGNGTHLTGEGYYKWYAPLIKAKMLELLS